MVDMTGGTGCIIIRVICNGAVWRGDNAGVGVRQRTPAHSSTFLYICNVRKGNSKLTHKLVADIGSK